MPAPDIRGLDIGMLKTFDALMRERSVSRAAARLFLSQPAVSASLNKLRRTFGDPLFTRTAHGVLPTARAEALAPQVERLLVDLAALLAEPVFDPARSDRVFRIAASDYAGSIVLPPLSRALAACGSGVRIALEPPGAGPLTERLHRGELDLAIVARLRPVADLRHLVLYEDGYVYALRAGHPRAAEPLTLDLFCDIPQTFLGYGSSVLDDTIDQALARSGRHRRAQVVVSSFAQILHQLEHADHAAVLGRRVAQAYADRLHLQPPPLPLPGYRNLLCWDARSEGDVGWRWLRDQVLAIYGRG